MSKPCTTEHHNFLVINWSITQSSRIARELMCNHCLQVFNLGQLSTRLTESQTGIAAAHSTQAE